MEARKGPALTRRKDYTPFGWLVLHTELLVQIYDQHALIKVSMSVKANPGAPATDRLVLEGEGLTLVSVEKNNQLVSASQLIEESGKLTITGLEDEQLISVTSRTNPYTNTALQGLYASGDMLCSQCEPEGFRRICYYPDRPDVMSIFTVRIEADKRYCHLLSNGNHQASGELEENRHYAIWHDPHKKPCYLFALVAGYLELVKDHFTTASGRHVDLHIYVEHGNAHLTSHAMTSLKRAMKWDEQVYGLEYDLDLFQIVAVSHFNMGAMENKGLNIFNSKFVLADDKTATDNDLDNVEAIIAHEYFHNWTGNRVTCRDWFQLTLKEGLTVFRDQSFSADMHDQAVNRAGDVATLRAIQFSEDSGVTAHPIRPETYAEINNFYTATIYEKGAEVIRMIHSRLGGEGFMAGMALYVKRHDGQAVTCDDFLDAMADANGVDLSGFGLWYQQAGTPQITVQRQKHLQITDIQDNKLTLLFSQYLAPTQAATTTHAMPVPIRLGFITMEGQPASASLDGGPVQDQHMVILEGSSQMVDVTLSDAKADTVIPSLLRGFSAPVYLEDDLSRDELAILAAHDTDSFNRYEANQRLAHMAIAARLAGEDSQAIEAALAGALATILGDRQQRSDFKALCLTIPGQSDTEQRCPLADPPLIWQTRYALQARLAEMLEAECAPYLRDGDHLNNAAGRTLRNVIVYMGIAARQEQAFETALAQSSDERMSLSMGGLLGLNQSDHPYRQKALAAFYKKWHSSSLVMEKWLMLEATSSCHSNIENLERVMQDPVFDASNPNKIRSVLGAFAAANPVQFHNENGLGYQFIAKQISLLDQRNPQIAARICLSLAKFGHYDKKRRDLMRNAVESLLANELSPDLQEIVAKALISKN